jgi:uncharacterized protein with GYD domain
MTTYVLLANWTEQGIRDIKDSPQRLDTAKKMLQDMGGSIRSFFLTMGDFDIVAIYEAPDDAIAARFVIQLGQLGDVRTHTLKAFPEAAYREIVASLW